MERFVWDFGDGHTGQGRTVSHAYENEGEFNVTLRVMDDKGETNSFQRSLPVGANVGSGNGLKAEYYDGERLEGRPTVRVTKQIAFRRQGWNGRFLCSHVGDNQGDHYSCRWTGLLQPTKAEEYTLTLDVNDGGRVWFDGRLVIDAWETPQSKSAIVGKLTAGTKYQIRIEHWKGTFEATRDWRALLYWQSPSTPREIIPPHQFYLPDGFSEPLP
jgi:hypothetical protein